MAYNPSKALKDSKVEDVIEGDPGTWEALVDEEFGIDTAIPEPLFEQEEPPGYIYFVRDADMLYRSTVNNRLLPNQILHSKGWAKGTGSLMLGTASDYDAFTKLERVTFEEAQEIARRWRSDLPTEGWQ